jgi:hypothetical protein
MLRILRNWLIGVGILVLLIWSGMLWAFLAMVPLWTWTALFVSVSLVTMFITKCWQQNEIIPFLVNTERPIYAIEGTDIIDAEVIDQDRPASP